MDERNRRRQKTKELAAWISNINFTAFNRGTWNLVGLGFNVATIFYSSLIVTLEYQCIIFFPIIIHFYWISFNLTTPTNYN